MFFVLVICLALLGFGVFFVHSAETYGQHSGAGEGALTVAQLLARVEKERRRFESTGRHALRDDLPTGAVVAG